MRLIKRIFAIFMVSMALVLSLTSKVEVFALEGTIGDSLEYNFDRYYRGVWVTPLAGNIPSCTNNTIDNYKAHITRMLDVMEFYNMNCVVFHIRIMNDALYPSKLNPRSNYNTADTDLLPWIIEECHKRGIEFHAWLNPYRVKSSGGGTVEEEAAKIAAKCPQNVGSKAENLLRNDSNGGIILNPGIPEVRQFIIDTCMEIIENYDVDAIHFDDYFYIENVVDDDTRAKYNPDNLSKDDWRREQVNIFIKDLSDTMRAYNEANNRYVQLGISPSGVWKSAGTKSYVEYDENGTCITNGSPTKNSFNHYEYYLYSDTKKWCDNEWIDYITPQTYWAITHSTAYFKPLIKWWDDVVKYKKVNLYSGMGIYMGRSGGNYSWGSDEYEAYNQVEYCYELPSTVGTCIYNYDDLLPYYKGQDTLTAKQMKHVKEKLWNNVALPPVIRTQKSVVLPAVTNLEVLEGETSNTITFDNIEGAKFFAIYRSSSRITFDSSELIKVIASTSSKVTFIDETSNGAKYSYGVKALSGNNTLGEGAKSNAIFTVEFKDEKGNLLKTDYVKYGEAATSPTISDANFVGWSRDISFVEGDMVVEARYKTSKFTVKFYDIDGKVIKTSVVGYQEKVEAPDPTIEGYDFISWTKGDYTKVEYDLDIYPIYEKIKCKVIFGYTDPETDEYVILKEDVVDYFDSATPPNESISIKGYEIKGWDKEYNSIKGDTKISYIIEPIYFTVKFINDEDGSIIDIQTVRYGMDATYPTPPEVKGMVFESWRGQVTRVLSDRVVRAVYGLAEYTVKFYDKEGNILKELVVCFDEEFDAPTIPELEGYEIIGWDTDFSEVLSDLDIHPIYHKNEITITYYDKDGKVLSSEVVKNEDKEIEANFEAPTLSGFNFVKWEKEVDEDGNVAFTAIYEKIEEPQKNGCKFQSIQSFFSMVAVLGLALILKKHR